jgi:hypothetical protein
MGFVHERGLLNIRKAKSPKNSKCPAEVNRRAFRVFRASGKDTLLKRQKREAFKGFPNVAERRFELLTLRV